MPNQFTRRGPGRKTEHDEATKDKIRAELIAQRLYRFAKAKGKSAEKQAMSQAQVAAAKVIVDKGKPSLQAIEQTQVNEYDKMTEQEMEDHVRALITSNPGLIERLGIKPQLVSSQDTDPAEHNTHESCTKAA